MNRLKTIITSLILYPVARLLVFKMFNSGAAIDQEIIIQIACETVLFVILFNLVLGAVQHKK